MRLFSRHLSNVLVRKPETNFAQGVRIQASGETKEESDLPAADEHQATFEALRTDRWNSHLNHTRKKMRVLKIVSNSNTTATYDILSALTNNSWPINVLLFMTLIAFCASSTLENSIKAFKVASSPLLLSANNCTSTI